jgi:hypothetical protein
MPSTLGDLSIRSWLNPDGTFTAYVVDDILFFESTKTSKVRGIAESLAKKDVRKQIKEHKAFKRRTR